MLAAETKHSKAMKDLDARKQAALELALERYAFDRLELPFVFCILHTPKLTSNHHTYHSTIWPPDLPYFFLNGTFLSGLVRMHKTN